MTLKDVRERAQTRPETVKRIMSRYFYRQISVYLTYLFLKMKWSANAVTLFSVVFGFLGFYFYSLGTPEGYVWGALMMGLFLLVDYSDGEVARYNDDQTMTGLFIELFAHYFINSFIYMGLAFGIYKHTQSEGVFLVAFLGLIGILFSKVRSILTWQVICVEHLRESKRMEYRNKSIEYKVKTVATDAPKVESPIVQRARKVNPIRQLFRMAVNPAVDDSNNINAWFAIAILNLFTPKIPVPFVENFETNLVEIFFVYCCAINILVLSVFLYRHIVNRVTEKAYNRFFIDKSDDLDFFFY